jgi:hypothetical protein
VHGGPLMRRLPPYNPAFKRSQPNRGVNTMCCRACTTIALPPELRA